MNLYATLEEAIATAREEYLAANTETGGEETAVDQFALQKYVMQDGDIMWQAEFLTHEGDESDCLPLCSGEAAQAIFDGDFDEVELREEWLAENTLHEWDDGEFQLVPPDDTEEGKVAAEEWEDDNSPSDRWN